MNLKKKQKQEKEEGIALCPECGSPMIEEDGEIICPKCDGEIDFFGDDE